MKILAIKTRALGDTVLWTAALEALCEISGTEIAIAFPKTYSPLFQSDTRFVHRYPLAPTWKENWETLRKIRAEKFDYALNFHASPHSRRFTLLTGAKRKLFHFHQRGKHAAGIPNAGIPMKATERDLNLVRAIGWSGKSPPTKLVFPKKHHVGNRVILAPGASRPAKQWSFDRWEALARALKNEFEPVFVIENLSHWKNRSFEIQAWKSIAEVWETPSLPKLIEAISSARVFVGSDSGAKHIACALGVSTVTLFGPESIGEWHCYDEAKNRAIQIPVLCRDNDPEPPEFSWCGVDVCPYASHACMALIEPEDVRKAISEVA